MISWLRLLCCPWNCSEEITNVHTKKRDSISHVKSCGLVLYKRHVDAAGGAKVLFSFHPHKPRKRKKISYRMFRHMHGVLNEVYL